MKSRMEQYCVPTFDNSEPAWPDVPTRDNIGAAVSSVRRFYIREDEVGMASNDGDNYEAIAPESLGSRFVTWPHPVLLLFVDKNIPFARVLETFAGIHQEAEYLLVVATDSVHVVPPSPIPRVSEIQARVRREEDSRQGQLQPLPEPAAPTVQCGALLRAWESTALLSRVGRVNFARTAIPAAVQECGCSADVNIDEVEAAMLLTHCGLEPGAERHEARQYSIRTNAAGVMTVPPGAVASGTVQDFVRSLEPNSVGSPPPPPLE